ncbi:UDP-N-acetylmuramoyl-tripeptide--D-alanyl-D-alanine ligase [Sciscionella sediminilitoris]|uniref:UDP-N-acetylmuramoyl-tripeptide--D-alanyl-D- alanine ligase n=1 Tax=Sciscionella sediminilitoris TaxID=1445613 RepID=UPI0004DEE98F|nr:UDP-N-acetylmuramoyl-tripeptide--D-alanyl-D-alanine ligase [Sciscionella sp. SE31]
MIELTLARIAEIVGGRLHRADGSETVTGTVEFDSRKLGHGGLFVALPGERVDGHTFAAKAVEAGASGVLAAREVDAPAVIVPPAAANSGIYALEADTDGSGAAVLAAMAALAAHVASELAAGGLRVIGVTGSAGKTSTKDLIGQLLEPLGPTVTPPGSFNAEIGVPWTVLRADRDTRFLVLEMAARGAGHIANLCRIATPSIGAVLNVGTSHVDEFGSREAIAQAKGELPAALPADGTAVLNADDPYVSAMATRARVLSFGTGDNAEIRAEDIRADELDRARFTLVTPDGRAEVALGLHGSHQVPNALAAAAVAHAAGAGIEGIAEALRIATPRSGKRMEVRTRADDVLVVNDAYNASPEAVRLALKSLATMGRSATPPRRTVAVLGAMAELGAESARLHDEIGRLAVRLDIAKLIVVGEGARPVHTGATMEGSWGEEAVFVEDPDAAVRLLRAQLRPHDVVLIKAANSLGFWRIAEAVLAEPTAATTTDGGTK